MLFMSQLGHIICIGLYRLLCLTRLYLDNIPSCTVNEILCIRMVSTRFLNKKDIRGLLITSTFQHDGVIVFEDRSIYLSFYRHSVVTVATPKFITAWKLIRLQCTQFHHFF